MVDETGWLIEVVKPNGPHWWTADCESGTSWSRDSNAAVRFSRELDAWRVIRGLGMENVKPTEHMWVGPEDKAGGTQ